MGRYHWVPVGNTQVNLRLSAETLARIDGVRGDVPRNVWLRRAVERELAVCRWDATAEGAVVRAQEPVVDSPAGAVPLSRAEAFRRAGVRPAREFRPYPKRGER